MLIYFLTLYKNKNQLKTTLLLTIFKGNIQQEKEAVSAESSILSYLSNIYSCRKIAKALQENIYFMWLSGNSTPDFGTINRFRGESLKEEIKTLFTQIVLLLQESGYVSPDVQYIDARRSNPLPINTLLSGVAV